MINRNISILEFEEGDTISCPNCMNPIKLNQYGKMKCESCDHVFYRRYKEWEKDTNEKLLNRIENVDEKNSAKKLLKRDLKLLVGDNKLKECSERLIEYFYSVENINQVDVNEAIQLKSRLARLNEQIRKGVIEISEFNVLMNQICDSFLFLIDRI